MTMRFGLPTLFAIASLMLAGCRGTGFSLPGAEDNPEAVATPERRVVVREATGTVEARYDAQDPWGGAQVGLYLDQGGQLRTGADGEAFLQLTEGSRIRLEPESTVTFNLLNPYLDSKLTAMGLDQGLTYILLNEGQIDVETPVGRATALQAYMSVAYDPDTQTVIVHCLKGTCSFSQTFIPETQKFVQTAFEDARPEPMVPADFRQWAASVPEAEPLANVGGDEAPTPIAQVSPTTEAPTAEAPATEPPTAAPATATAVPSTATAVLPTGTLVLPTATLPPATATSLPPTATVVRATATNIPPARPTSTTRPNSTPITRATSVPGPTRTPIPSIGTHRVVSGETLFCIGRAYGVIPSAIAAANGLGSGDRLIAGQVLAIPAARWMSIQSGPVCVAQFQSPYPGLPYTPPSTNPPQPTAADPSPEAPTPTASPAAPLVVNEVAALCIGGCADGSSTYRLRIIVSASGGVGPLQYSPGQQYDIDIPRCTKSSGTVTVTSADGQTAVGSWVYDDIGCVPTSAP
jgi:LysM repeat protein